MTDTELEQIVDMALAYEIEREKQQHEEIAALIGKENAEGGSRSVEGLGQVAIRPSSKEYHRWNQLYPGCWQDEAFVKSYWLKNEYARVPGWRPK